MPKKLADTQIPKGMRPFPQSLHRSYKKGVHRTFIVATYDVIPEQFWLAILLTSNVKLLTDIISYRRF